MPSVVGALVKQATNRALRRRSEATERRYLRQAFGHPLNVSVIVVLSVFALAYGAFPWLVLGVALELMALSTLLHTEFFRRRAERHLAETELAQLRLSLDGSQLRELQRLEELAAAVQKAASRPDSACSLLLADGEMLRRLLERYLRLALVHKAGRELIASTDRRALEIEIESLERSVTTAPPAVRRLQEQRLELARRRVERLELAAQRVEMVTQQLAAIVEMIHFLHEQALAPSGQGWACSLELEDDLERLIGEVGDLGEHEVTLRELDRAIEPARL